MVLKLVKALEISESVSSVCLQQNLTANELEVAAAVGFGLRFIRVNTLNDTFYEGEAPSISSE